MLSERVATSTMKCAIELDYHSLLANRFPIKKQRYVSFQILFLAPCHQNAEVPLSRLEKRLRLGRRGVVLHIWCTNKQGGTRGVP